MHMIFNLHRLTVTTSEKKRYFCSWVYQIQNSINLTIEPPHGKTNNLHMRKQRRRSASR